MPAMLLLLQDISSLFGSGVAAIRTARVCIGNHIAQWKDSAYSRSWPSTSPSSVTNPASRLCPSPSSS